MPPLHLSCVRSPLGRSFFPRRAARRGSLRFPYTTLFRSRQRRPSFESGGRGIFRCVRRCERYLSRGSSRGRTDRKSTRLNSSHVSISYAVFCLKKKNQLFASLLVATVYRRQRDTVLRLSA